MWGRDSAWPEVLLSLRQVNRPRAGARRAESGCRQYQSTGNPLDGDCCVPIAARFVPDDTWAAEFLPRGRATIRPRSASGNRALSLWRCRNRTAGGMGTLGATALGAD